VEILSRAFYALHNTLTPVLVGVAAMSLNVIFSIGFSNLFTRMGWAPHGGLALANSLATTLEMLALLFLMSRKITGINWGEIMPALWQTAVATLGMSVGLWVWLQLTQDQPTWLIAIGGALIGGALFILIALSVGIREVRLVVSEVQRRLRR
jgi:putative peptidoglycan lipid II flippase